MNCFCLPSHCGPWLAVSSAGICSDYSSAIRNRSKRLLFIPASLTIGTGGLVADTRTDIKNVNRLKQVVAADGEYGNPTINQSGTGVTLLDKRVSRALKIIINDSFQLRMHVAAATALHTSSKRCSGILGNASSSFSQAALNFYWRVCALASGLITASRKASHKKVKYKTRVSQIMVNFFAYP